MSQGLEYRQMKRIERAQGNWLLFKFVSNNEQRRDKGDGKLLNMEAVRVIVVLELFEICFSQNVLLMFEK